jgi:hypothetical protein
MGLDDSDFEADEITSQDGRTHRHDSAEQRKLSRLERLKKKIKGLQGKDPDIYPMW